jgi:hypothetical protein
MCASQELITSPMIRMTEKDALILYVTKIITSFNMHVFLAKLELTVTQEIRQQDKILHVLCDIARKTNV